jgi:hypothetical protein
MLSSGPFCPVLFARGRDGLQTYTHRGLLGFIPKGSLVDFIITVTDDREFHQRFINTEFRAPAKTFRMEFLED